MKFGSLLCLACVLACSQVASAVIVAGNYANQSDASVNTTAGSVPGAFPYWNYVGQVGTASTVYLGNDWMITAAHLTIGSTATLNGVTYNIVNNSGVVLKNPNNVSVPLAGRGQNTDLLMFKIQIDGSHPDPNLPVLPISNSGPQVNDASWDIGRGVDRSSSISYWDSAFNPASSSSFTYEGYTLGSSQTTRWGDNLVSQAPAWTNIGSMSNPLYIHEYRTQFDVNGTANEFQVTLGDSGGAAFSYENNHWALSGINIANTIFTNQNSSGQKAIFGNASIIADLSTYHSQISSLVPEPSTFMLVAAGGIAYLVTAARRRRATRG